MSKGILFTASMVLLALSVLSFASTVLSESEARRAEESKLFAVDRVDYVYKNIEANVAEIFRTSSGIALEIDSDAFSFEEKLPNPHSTDFSRNIDRYAEFLDNRSIDLNNEYITENLGIEAVPQGAVYSHDPFGGDVIKFESPTAPAAYDILITTYVGGASGITWSPYSSGNMSVTIEVDGSPSYSETRLINPSGTTNANITLSGGRGTISVLFENGNMTLTKHSDFAVNVLTSVEMGETYSLELYDALSVWSHDVSASRNGTIRVK